MIWATKSFIIVAAANSQAEVVAEGECRIVDSTTDRHGAGEAQEAAFDQGYSMCTCMHAHMCMHVHVWVLQ